MNTIALAALFTLAMGQQKKCEFKGGPDHTYTLNLTSISGWRMEYESSAEQRFYYYTPCTNGELCSQGNGQFWNNAVEYTPGLNQCDHYLSVDHHDQPKYFFSGAAWLFDYNDGELCSVTQEPRELSVWMLCDENLKYGAYVYDVEEYQTCKYSMTIRTPLACVPESSHNANCQWRQFDDKTNTTYYLDLSTQKGTVLRGQPTDNGYDMYYTPCQNALPCYQQTGSVEVMSIVENYATRTCDHYLAEWQDGRVAPVYHSDPDRKDDPENTHWSFHYYLSQKCSNGLLGEETIRWYCDYDAKNATVINTTYDGDCRWEFNVKSELACPDKGMGHTHKEFKLHTLRY